MSEWINIHNKRPAYGEPVLIVANGVTQRVTFCMDGTDDCSDWFEPVFFEHDDNLKVWWHQVEFWMPLPEPPSKEEV